MQIILKNLVLENFKGVREFAISPNGQGLNAVISGQNGTGKTTQMDAFLWLLFGKNSQGKSDFAIKTLNSDGSEAHNLNHSVEASLEIDGDILTLKKVLYEKYTKKRGTSGQEFTGHSTDFYLNGVPVQKREWDKRISEIINEDTLKLLTDPMYFNSLHWTKRREILLDVCGNISTSDVIASDKTLSGLLDILNGKSIDDYKKIVAAKKNEINKKLVEIPARIDELNKSVSDVSGYKAPLIEKRIKELEEIIQTAKSDKSASILRSQKMDLQTKIRELEEKIEGIKRQAKQASIKKLEGIQSQNRENKTALRKIINLITSLKENIESNETRLKSLRNDFFKYQQQTFTPAPAPQLNDTACPKCGYVLAGEENEKRLQAYNEATQKAEESFRAAQAQAMRDINSKGKKLAEENKEHNESIVKFDTEKEQLEKAILELGRQEAIASEELDYVDVTKATEKETAQIVKLKAELTEIEKKIEGSLPPDTSDMEAQKRAEEVKLAEIESNKKTKARIDDLMKEEKKLAAEYEKLEGEISMIEKFIVQKVSLLEDKINSKFELARFRMFETQINGGINEVCETMYNGVPFSSGLNTGMQINIGLDIIRTLSDHYNVKCPIFVDHAESVNSILQAGSQMFHLTVNDNPELTVSYF